MDGMCGVGFQAQSLKIEFLLCSSAGLYREVGGGMIDDARYL